MDLTPSVSVETDKAVVDVEAPAGGVLLRIDAPVDREYPVGATLAWIGAAGEALPDRADETIAAPAAVSADRRVTPVARGPRSANSATSPRPADRTSA